ncbi:hypothetical protein BDD12DRAFT_864366 [Trichophaea hybrida]|nr:hypothetical protein BDD12DRAFT_864366 [Trichophaea hybrida]
MVLRIPILGAGLMAILGLMGRADLRVRFAGGIYSLISMQIGPVGASECERDCERECECEDMVIVHPRDIHGGDG